MLTRLEYALLRSPARERQIHVQQEHIHPETFGLVSKFLNFLQPVSFSLRQPSYGWRDNELYITYTEPSSRARGDDLLFCRLLLNVNAQGLSMEREGVRLVLLNKSNRIWKFSPIPKEQVWTDLTKDIVLTMTDLVKTFEYCRYHPDQMDLGVTPKRHWLRWYCKECSMKVYVPEILRNKVFRYTSTEFILSKM